MTNKHYCQYTKVWFFLLSVILFSSCASLKQEQYKGIKNLTSLEELEGQYYRIIQFSDTAKTFPSIIDSTKILYLKKIDKNKLEYKIYKKDSLMSEEIITGKIKDNYFISDHKRTIIPIPFIIGIIENYQEQYSVQNNLIKIDVMYHRWGWFLFFIASNDDEFSMYYTKKKNE